MPVFTITSGSRAQPRVGDGGPTTVTDVDVTDARAAGLPFPKSTAVTAPRFDPDTVTAVPPPAGPEDAEIPVTTGQVPGGGARKRLTSASAIGVPSPVARSYPGVAG